MYRKDYDLLRLIKEHKDFPHFDLTGLKLKLNHDNNENVTMLKKCLSLKPPFMSLYYTCMSIGEGDKNIPVSLTKNSAACATLKFKKVLERK